MNDQEASEAAGVTQARNLLAEAAQEVERLDKVASQAFCRLTALAEMLPQLERVVVVHKPEAVETVTLDAATTRREAQLLLRSIYNGEESIRSLCNLVHFLALGL